MEFERIKFYSVAVIERGPTLINGNSNFFSISSTKIRSNLNISRLFG